MKYLNESMDLKEVKAETLLSLWNIHKDFHVRMEGIFSRNYAEDLISLENEDDKPVITLSRDSIFHLFPQSLFFTENKLKEDSKRRFDFKKEYAELKKQKQEVKTFFQPFDTECFKLNLELEHRLNQLTQAGNEIFNSIFPDDIETDTSNRYIAKIKRLIPYASQIRGNLPLLIDILKNVLDVEKIEMTKIGLFHIRFIIHKEGLSKKEYIDMDNDLALFFEYFQYRFLPVEQKFDFRIKDYKQPFTLGATLILDYNTHL